MSDKQPTLSIPRDVIEPIINAHVNTAILSALGDGSEIMRKAISAVLFTKVDNEGRPESYPRDSNPTRIDWMVRDAIQAAAKEAILEAVQLHKVRIKKCMADSMTKANSPLMRQLAEALVGALTDPETLKWRLNVSAESRPQ